MGKTYIKTCNLPLQGTEAIRVRSRIVKVYFDEISGDIEVKMPEKRLDKQFDWAGYHWVIPQLIHVAKDLSLILYVSDSESIRDFMKMESGLGK